MYILYHGILLSHVDVHMKEYVKTRNCRRKELLKHFNCFGYQHDVAMGERCVTSRKTAVKETKESCGRTPNKLQQNLFQRQKVKIVVLINILKVPKNSIGGTCRNLGMKIWSILPQGARVEKKYLSS